MLLSSAARTWCSLVANLQLQFVFVSVLLRYVHTTATQDITGTPET